MEKNIAKHFVIRKFGRIYEKGQYPEWDEDHPIHFVGYSAGAQVVRVLQQILADMIANKVGNGEALCQKV
ncbi:hypothetical protein IFM89_037406 [Coptis chinensis]|uniref:Uncharacterized protein n=1 Tax=Coptis chinensis TaxID=261450 RepID=A0A835II36_9MAGN|nr:hypothetical protein IFM89_037406 [Coptis chinensis]